MKSTVHIASSALGATSEDEICRLLRTMGASVHRLKEASLPRLLVGYRHKTFLIHIGGINDSHRHWRNFWNGRPSVSVKNAEEALAVIGITFKTRST